MRQQLGDLARFVGSRASTPFKYGYGSCTLSLADRIRLISAAARLLPHNDTATRTQSPAPVPNNTWNISICRVISTNCCLKSQSKKIQTYITSVNAHRINCGGDLACLLFG